MSSIEYLQFANISANTVVAILMLSTNWVVNQPTKSWDLRKRKTSSLGRLNHSCTRNAAYKTHRWNWKRNLKYSNWEYAYANGFVVLAEGFDMFTLESTANGGNMNSSGNLSLWKELWLDECLGLEPSVMGSLQLKVSNFHYF
jgi:hypothetical protein